MAISSPAQTFTTLTTFVNTNGAYPYGTLVQGLDGNFYGTTFEGARNICFNGCGEVFKITPTGTLTVLHQFITNKGVGDGANPYAGLVLATNGDFYGTTVGYDGNTASCGTVFQITDGGTLTTVYSGFCDGERPYAALLQDTVNGNFYGTTFSGGIGNCGPVPNNGCGTIFEITPSGTLTTLHNFCNFKNCSDGALPTAPLVQDSNRTLYSTTSEGGVYCGDPNIGYCGYGTFFSIGAGGSFKELFEFGLTGILSAGPVSGVVIGSDGTFYGATTKAGGIDQCGTIFKITAGGALTTLHSFSLPDGCWPTGTLIQGTDGNFYGTTMNGGAFTCTGGAEDPGCGTIFQMTPDGAVTTLHSFDKTDGAYPHAGLVQGTDGNFYGTTGGFNGFHLYGTVFQLSMGLAPFVKTVPASSYTGAQVLILGTNLTSATRVTFNGKPAVFTVVSPTEIQATVPGPATTGTVQVVTPSGTLSSSVPFQVL